MNNKTFFLFHILIFKLIWIVAVLSAYSKNTIILLLLTIVYVVMHLFYNKFSVINFIKVLIFAIIGVMLDAANIYFEVFKITNMDYYFIPVWLLLLWVGFSIFALDILNRMFKNIYILALLCGITAPFSYLAGDSMNILSYGDYGMIILFFEWLIILPYCMHKSAY